MSRTPDGNILTLSKNPYPGRGIVVGVNMAGQFLIQVYWIMGRSAHSRNRVFTRDGGRIFTEPADPQNAGDTSLIIYNAMRESVGSVSVVSNGNQTDTVIDAIAMRRSFRQALEKWQYEPDKPNFTPRITALCTLRGLCLLQMAILRKGARGDECDRCFFDFASGDISRGHGYCITTYSGDGTPLPAFRGEPYVLPLVGTIEDVAETYWRVLNPEHMVSLAVKFIDIVSGESTVLIRNKFVKIGQC